MPPTEQLTARLRALRIKVEEFEEFAVRSGGPGGQNVNKVSTAVTVRHLPSDLAVTASDSRSQHQNRILAWDRLLEKIARLRAKARAEARAAREKERRRTRPRPPALKRQIRKSKERRAAVKERRGRVRDE
jgi:protein subunit release factor B